MDTVFSIKWLKQLWREPEALEQLRARPIPGILASLAVVAVLAGVQWLLWDWVRPLYFFFLYPAIVISLLLTGFRGGISSTLFSCLVAWLFMAAQEDLRSTQDHIRLALFFGNGVLISAAVGFLVHRYRQLISQRLQELLSRMDEGFVTLDSNLRFLSANKRALELWKTTGDVLFGQNSLSFFQSKDLGILLEQKMREVQRSGHTADFEVFVPRIGQWLDFHAYPALHGIALFFREITEKKVSEELLREKAREAVEASVKLRSSNRELERSNAELAQFAHIASHDMKEPLRVISNYVDLLEQQYTDRLDDNARLFIRFAADGAKRMHSLINDILRYSEIEAEPPLNQDLDLNQVVRESLTNLSAQLKETNAKVSYTDLPIVVGPSRQMVRVFQNLISNALKFRRPDVAAEIQIGVREERENIVLWVKDNGIGIEPEQKGKVFQLFKRIHSRAQYPGSGIGLATCKRIIERLGGRIWLDSTPGLGTTFYFSLPRAQGNVVQFRKDPLCEVAQPSS